MSKICPKCEQSMVAGQIASVAHNGIQRLKLFWLRGPIRRGFLSGHAIAGTGDQEEIVDYACENCGYIESYLKKFA